MATETPKAHFEQPVLFIESEHTRESSEALDPDWRRKAACRREPVDIFTDYGRLAEALKFCQACPVVKECGAYAEEGRDKALKTPTQERDPGDVTTGVWGGKWIPMPVVEEKRFYRRELALRMLEEADENMVWEGNPRKQKPLPGRTEQETYHDGRGLEKSGTIEPLEPSEEGKSRWKIMFIPDPVESPTQRIWEHIVNSAHMGRFEADYDTLIRLSGAGSEASVIYRLSILQRLGCLEKKAEGEYEVLADSVYL